MPDRVTIAEIRLHTLKGDFPEVKTYPHVNTNLLYQGDTDPFHIVLPIAEIGRVSKNGLEYDTALVEAIAEQLQTGIGGIRGHIPDDSLSTSYPIDDVLWVGHSQQGDTLFAKGYVPPGDTRDDIRRKMAIGGTVGTSIFGNAIKETSQTKKRSTWRAKEFKLEQVDLAPSQRAALENRRGFLITKETIQEGEEMPDVREITSIAEVPQAIREQIIRESDLAAKAGRVAEIETEAAGLRTQVAELAQYKSIVAEIRTTLGENADIPALVAEYYGAVSKLTTMLGVKDVDSISVRVEEMQTVVAEFEKKDFEGAVDTKVAELTNWNPKSDEGQKKVAKFRANFRRNVLAGLGNERASEKIAETAQTLWDEEYSDLARGLVAELGGPSAIVGGKPNPTPAGAKDAASREAEVREKFGIQSSAVK